MTDRSEAKPDIDDLVASLRARVEARRASGEYPIGLEEEMTAHFQRIVAQRRGARPTSDVQGPVRAAGEALPLQVNKIPLESDIPGGRALHSAIAHIVGRQTRGSLQQVQAFAQPAHAALEALAAAVEELERRLDSDVTQSLDAIYERQAAQERLLAAVGVTDTPRRGSERRDAVAISDEERRRRAGELAGRLVGDEPVLDIGFDMEGEALRHLRSLDDKALGGVTAIQVIPFLSAQAIVDFVALVADKVRPGGRVFVEVFEPRSLSAPPHPAFLVLLFREAGFSAVDIEWHSPLPAESVDRLNNVLFAQQGYLIVATL